jgi:hypothetical protein
VHAKLGRRLRLAADVNLGRGILSHQHHGQPWGAACVLDDAGDTRTAFGFYLIANVISI